MSIGTIEEQLILCDNGYIIYVDIMAGEKLLSIYVANMELIYWSVRPSTTTFTLLKNMKI